MPFSFRKDVNGNIKTLTDWNTNGRAPQIQHKTSTHFKVNFH